jgi:pSer/pThr/pTyr-binding forkhead associated (FHA) protein
MDDDDKTVVMPKRRWTASGSVAPVTVRYRDKQGDEQVRQFTTAFVIGRERSCDVRLGEVIVSRRHAEVIPGEGGWRVRDLDSVNGTFIGGARIEEHPLQGTTELQLGKAGPVVWLDMPNQQGDETAVAVAGGARGSAENVRRYVDPAYSGPMGDHTRMVRHAFTQAKQRQSRNYLYVIGVACVVLVGAFGYALYQQFQLDKLESLTVDIFYNMKEMELQVARLENSARESGDSRQAAELSAMRARVTEMESRYDTYLDEIGLFKQAMSEEDKLIFRVARIFGECEVNLPEDFAKEVKTYIAKWQATDRLARAIKRARVNGYTPLVQEAMLQHYLPPQFFYLALQESNYERGIVGPETRYGIAKGIWQFIPTTARRYGLQTGPLLEVRRYDPKDERFDFSKATIAAASYLRDIYTTEAQASGLLVMASYNWGEHRVTKLIKQMPENPRQRNFWELIKQHTIPEETYNYVYYIFAAAVIGENPQLFGFDFDNPLATPAEQAANAIPVPAGAGLWDSSMNAHQ